MLLEFIQYLTNPGSKFARQLGYNKELIAINARYKRNKTAWRTHLQNSQNTILQAAELCPTKNHTMILGAGLLYDIPIAQLVRTFQHITLVDIAFSAQAKKVARTNKKIELIEHDLNGLDQNISGLTRDTLSEINACLPQTKQPVDLIISANVLSQLHLAPVHFLEEKLKLREEVLFEFAQQLLQAHIDLLRGQTSRVCLITDYLRFHEIRGNKTCESALLGIELPEPDQSWRWQIAPEGELAKNESMETLVYAYQDFNHQ
ncbi:MAG: hypothetical protein R3240_03215 [Gammaproteobacteria bacterium]|nr:hypothetical protein [Gammaproteobacteria bacterium]